MYSFLTDIHKIDCFLIHIKVHSSLNNFELYFINKPCNDDYLTVKNYVDHKLHYYQCRYEHLKIHLSNLHKTPDIPVNNTVRNLLRQHVEKDIEDLSVILDITIRKEQILIREKRSRLSDIVKK